MSDITEQMRDVSKSRNKSFLHWFVIAAITKGTVTDEMRAEPRILTLTLNGVELDALKAFKRLEEEYDRRVGEAASELFQEAKNDILEPFEEEVERMTSELDALIDRKILAWRCESE